MSGWCTPAQPADRRRPAETRTLAELFTSRGSLVGSNNCQCPSFKLFNKWWLLFFLLTYLTPGCWAGLFASTGGVQKPPVLGVLCVLCGITAYPSLSGASSVPAPTQTEVSQLEDCTQPILSILVSLALIIPVVSVLLLLPSSLRLIALILKTGDVAEMERVICPRDRMKVLLIAPGCQWQFGENVIFAFFPLYFRFFLPFSAIHSFAQNVVQS